MEGGDCRLYLVCTNVCRGPGLLSKFHPSAIIARSHLLRSCSASGTSTPVDVPRVARRESVISIGEPVEPDVVSRFYDSMGNTLDYVFDLDGDSLTIWAGAKDSPAYFHGTFSDNDHVLAGAWVYPEEGGYDSTMKRR